MLHQNSTSATWAYLDEQALRTCETVWLVYWTAARGSSKVSIIFITAYLRPCRVVYSCHNELFVVSWQQRSSRCYIYCEEVQRGARCHLPFPAATSPLDMPKVVIAAIVVFRKPDTLTYGPCCHLNPEHLNVMPRLPSRLLQTTTYFNGDQIYIVRISDRPVFQLHGSSNAIL